ncbi:MAG TPA: adenosylcobinamide-GDP ribazoletransferase [Longimicrobium sp.]|uniref:adenosylcobinamide-GDP ribazoletransferase n=1 Tax=Longimicrobium sp. TaxID=2029185 RepID=UPI002ED89E6A
MSGAPAAPAGEGSWFHRQLRAFLTGVMFLTRLPCPAWVGHDAEYLARSTVYFPLIGLMVGAAGAAGYWVGSLAWSPVMASIAALSATVWLTGAFHEDGLADSFDGMGGGWTPDEMLTIMKDSRMGTYGTIALLLVVFAKLAALSEMFPIDAMPAIVAGHVLGRWSSLPLIWRLPYVQHSGSKSKPFAASVTTGRLMAGTLLMLVIVAALLGWAAVPVIGTVLGVTVVGGWYLRRVLGAVNQLVEVATYLVLVGDFARLLPGGT